MNGDLDDFRLSEPERLPPFNSRQSLTVALQDALTAVLVLMHRLEIISTEATEEEVSATRSSHPTIEQVAGKRLRIHVNGMGS